MDHEVESVDRYQHNNNHIDSDHHEDNNMDDSPIIVSRYVNGSSHKKRKFTPHLSFPTALKVYEEDKQVLNNYDDNDSESCESIPEEYNDQATANNSPTHSNSGTSINMRSNEVSKRSSKNKRESSFGTREEIYERLRHPNSNPSGSNEDTVKKMYPIYDTESDLKQPKDRKNEFAYKPDQFSSSAHTEAVSTNDKPVPKSDKNASPFKFYRGNNHKSVTHLSANKRNSAKTKTKYKSNSFILNGSSSLGVKKENIIYGKSLEEFIESNIKCINDLIEYKQQVNHDIIRNNTRRKAVKSEYEYEIKRKSQLKMEMQNAIAGKFKIINQQK
jgi:hypothetical protein